MAVHKLDFFRGEKWATLAVLAPPQKNINGQGVAILIQNCQVEGCDVVASKVRGPLQLCVKHARAYDEEHR